VNEKTKIQEARFFYDLMVKEQENLTAFKFYLSAFLTAARSVMYYARDEARKKRKGLRWYDDWMSSIKVLSFFRDKRDFSIHTAPVNPRKHVHIHITEAIRISESIHIKVTDKNGNVKEEREIKEAEKSKETPKSSFKSESRYEFDDWHGQEDVITLCGIYIHELEKAVQDGITKGFITG